MIVKSDKLGLYVHAGGWKSRPLSESRFKLGDDIKTHHYGGTILAGVGKDKTCKRGKYIEMWITTDLSMDESSDLEEYQLAWRKREALIMYGHCHFEGVSMTHSEEALANAYFKKHLEVRKNLSRRSMARLLCLMQVSHVHKMSSAINCTKEIK